MANNSLRNRINRTTGVTGNSNGAGTGGRAVTQRRDTQSRPGARGKYGPRATYRLTEGAQQRGTRSQRSYDIRSAFRSQAIDYNQRYAAEISSGQREAMFVNSAG